MTAITAADLNWALEAYSKHVRAEFEFAITNWPIELHRETVHAVLGGLLARQCVLGSEFASQPQLWNFAVGPLFIRSMVELYINFAWICLDAVPRCREFHLYGLGQAKLAIEYARSLEHLLEQKSPGIKAQELWLNSQRHEMFTDVNVGAWSGTTLKDMAAEANIPQSFLLYSSLTGGAHGSWDHVFQLYLDDPSSGEARPSLHEPSMSSDFVMSAGRVLNDTFRIFFSFTEQQQQPKAYQKLAQILRPAVKSEDPKDGE